MALPSYRTRAQQMEKTLWVNLWTKQETQTAVGLPTWWGQTFEVSSATKLEAM
jgi:hypothetical protein